MATHTNPSIPPSGATPGQSIDLTKETDVAYWCEIFGVDPAQLRRAVGAAGPQAVEVARQLRSKQQGGDRA